MDRLFAETLKMIRAERGLTQKALAERMWVTRSTITHWENGTRLPDAAMLNRLAKCLDVEIYTLLGMTEVKEDSPDVIMVDDNKIILSGSLSVLEEVMPGATVIGFSRPSEAIDYAGKKHVDLAFLDIELGKVSGLMLCRTLLDINPRTNVVFLTAHTSYALEAWSTGACGYMLKPITAEAVKAQLKNLRHPFNW